MSNQRKVVLPLFTRWCISAKAGVQFIRGMNKELKRNSFHENDSLEITYNLCFDTSGTRAGFRCPGFRLIK